jgi:hypothetical protein
MVEKWAESRKGQRRARFGTHWPNEKDRIVHEIGLTDSRVILIDVGGPADGAAFIITSRH